MDRNKSALSDLARAMGITAEEITRRKSFLELSESDIALLREVHDHIETIHIDDSFAELFYHHLLAFPELRKFIPDDATLDRLKAVQSQYFRRLTSGEYEDDYILDRLRVGCAHQRIGLEPRWYTGAYRKYLSFLLSILHEVAEGDGEKFLAYYDALLKVVFFDMELALDTYFHSDRQELVHMANHDALTGLPNRNLLSDRIEQAVHQAHREGNKVAVLFIDLDRFKNINDSLGHAVGDKVITAVSTRLAESLREGDSIARLGGDEFVAVLTGVEHEETITAVAGKLLNSLDAPVQVNMTELFVTASIGIATYPADGQNQNELLKNADTAMYLSKQEGGNTFRFYRHEMNLLSLARLNLEARLRQALKKHEFLLHYQPQVDTASGRIIGVEALLRWHPNGITVFPSDFVPLIEETGLIIPVGEWVLDTACRQAVAWHEAGTASLRVAVNISARQFLGQDIVETVSRTLAKTGCAPSWLELEITESAVMKHPEESALKLKQLAAMGITISIDDFGTGYSSLAYLKQFPAHALKIDRSFVEHIGAGDGDDAIIQAVIGLARGLNIKVVGEGVEDETQHAFLHSHGCDMEQGYYFSRPLPAEEITQLLLRSPFLPNSKAVSTSSFTVSNDMPVMDISHCTVSRKGPSEVRCMVSGARCRFLFGENCCGHPLVDQIADVQSALPHGKAPECPA